MIAKPTKPIAVIGGEPNTIACSQIASEAQAIVIRIWDFGLSLGRSTDRRVYQCTDCVCLATTVRILRRKLAIV
jgi:hypothetical protein